MQHFKLTAEDRAWLFQCRTRLCGWCSEQVEEAISIAENVSMPHAALWVVQPEEQEEINRLVEVSMPHAALWVVQRRYVLTGKLTADVSMPHAALWVVQPRRSQLFSP